jgi:hypothetical protein
MSVVPRHVVQPKRLVRLQEVKPPPPSSEYVLDLTASRSGATGSQRRPNSPRHSDRLDFSDVRSGQTKKRLPGPQSPCCVGNRPAPESCQRRAERYFRVVCCSLDVRIMPAIIDINVHETWSRCDSYESCPLSTLMIQDTVKSSATRPHDIVSRFGLARFSGIPLAVRPHRVEDAGVLSSQA